MRRALLRWYDDQRRPLPWRRSTDWYPVWVAETMLQQTRIAVVIPAYERFMARFPTVGALAKAQEDEVLSQWSGLGYYTRARSLWRSAQQLVAEQCDFPRTAEEARQLPGVGPYTAAAVLSIAYRQPHAAVDGNIRRVLARLACIEAGELATRSAELAGRLLDRRRPGDWNQALMELGETICTAPAPRCTVCPIERWCVARQRAVVDRYPARQRRAAREQIDLDMLLIRDRQGALLLERGAFRYLPHMWLPTLLTDRHAVDARPAQQFRHAILQRDFTVRMHTALVQPAALRKLAGGGEHDRRVFAARELASIGRSALLTKAIAAGENKEGNAD